MTLKTLTAGVLAATLTFTTIAPTTVAADISRDEAIVGIATLLLLGAAIHESRDDDSEPARTSTRNQRHQQNWRVLPSSCLRQVTRRNGNNVRFFGQSCLNSNYQAVNRLPNDCRVSFQSRQGQQRRGYSAQCLQNNGFRTNRR